MEIKVNLQIHNLFSIFNFQFSFIVNLQMPKQNPENERNKHKLCIFLQKHHELALASIFLRRIFNSLHLYLSRHCCVRVAFPHIYIAQFRASDLSWTCRLNCLKPDLIPALFRQKILTQKCSILNLTSSEMTNRKDHEHASTEAS